jgi:hypothetical protein
MYLVVDCNVLTFGAETILAKSKSFEEMQQANKEEKRALKDEHLRLREEISVARHVADDEKKKAAAETARVAGIELAKIEAIARSDAEKEKLRDLVVSFRRVAVQSEQVSRLEKRLSSELQLQIEERDKSIAILDDALYKSRLSLQEHLFEETESAVREKADRESRRTSALAELFKSHKDEALHFKKRCDELTKLAGSLNEIVGDKEAKLKALADEKDILRRRSEELQKKGQVLERRLFNLEHALEEKKPSSMDELDEASIAMVSSPASSQSQCYAQCAHSCCGRWCSWQTLWNKRRPRTVRLPTLAITPSVAHFPLRSDHWNARCEAATARSSCAARQSGDHCCRSAIAAAQSNPNQLRSSKSRARYPPCSTQRAGAHTVAVFRCQCS